MPIARRTTQHIEPGSCPQLLLQEHPSERLQSDYMIVFPVPSLGTFAATPDPPNKYGPPSQN